MSAPTATGAAPGAAGGGAGRRFGLLVAGLLLVGLAIWLTPLGALVSRERALALLTAVRQWPLAPLVFVLIYALAAGLALPGSALTLAGGAIFGVWPGLALNWAGATLGSAIAFLLARHLGREYVSRRLGGRIAALDQNAGRHGFLTILFLRLVPLVPFNALNYGAGLSSIGLRDYVLATGIGILPGAFAYTYFAAAILAGSLEARHSAYLHMLLAGGLLLLLSLLPLAWRRWKPR
jgi:uncharacterized membrane protein YdjX (TVP38/TMEM64 family)